MKRVIGNEFEQIRPHFDAAAVVAVKATCLQARCGSVIIKDDIIIGSGYNSPALEDESQRFCSAAVQPGEHSEFDKTCCVHAEWRAVLDASKHHPDKLAGSTLYFMRVDAEGTYTDAGDPFCTVCSRLTMEAGISNFALYNDNGADIYPLDEYNLKSYQPYIAPKSATINA